jgi:hypothetical protein
MFQMGAILVRYLVTFATVAVLGAAGTALAQTPRGQFAGAAPQNDATESIQPRLNLTP